MGHIVRSARINIKALIILIMVIGVLGVGAFGAHYVRKRVIAQGALEDGKAALDREEWSEAAKHLRRYLGKYPDDTEMLREYAEAHLSVRPREPENILQAIAAYRRLYRQPSLRGDDVLSDKLARLYLSIRDFSEAIYICKERLAQDPTDASASILMAQALMYTDEYEEATELLKNLVETHHPQEVEAYVHLSNLSLLQNQSDSGVQESGRWLDRAVERNPDSAFALVHRARYHTERFRGRKERDLVAARRDLESAEAMNPEAPEVVLLLGSQWLAMGDAEFGDERQEDFERARAHLAQVDLVDPKLLNSRDIDPDAFAGQWFRRASALALRSGDPAEMISIVERGLAELSGGIRSKYLETAIELELVAGQPKSLESAKRHFAEYRDIVTGSPDGNLLATDTLALLSARVDSSTGRPYKAIKVLQQLVSENPRNLSAWRLLAQAYIDTRQSRHAIRALETYLSQRPNDITVRTQLVRQYLRKGDTDQAVRHARVFTYFDKIMLSAQLVYVEASVRAAIDRGVPKSAFDDWLERLDGLREEHPGVSEIRMLQAIIAIYQERPDDALLELEQADRECSPAPAIAYQRAGLLGRLGRLEEAIEVARSATEQFPDQAHAWTNLARLSIEADGYGAALSVLQQGVEISWTPGVRRSLIRAIVQLHLVHHEKDERLSRQAGIDLLNDLVEQDNLRDSPSDVWPRTTLLELREVFAKGPGAQELVDELGEIDGAELPTLLHQARVWMRTSQDARSNKERIINALSRYMEADPDAERPVLMLGGMHEQLGEVVEAERVYRAGVDMLPEDASLEVVDRLLRLLERQNRGAEAKDILDLVPQDLQRKRLGAHRVELAIDSGEYTTAIQELERRVAETRDDVNGHVLLARLVYRERRDVARAMAELDKAAAIDPESLVAVATRVDILLAEERPDEARVQLDALLARRADFAAHLMRAQFFVAVDDLEAAESEYRRLTAFEDSAASGYELLGKFHRSQGKMPEALIAWEHGLEKEPSSLSLRRLTVQGLIVSPNEEDQRRGRQLLTELVSEYPDAQELMATRVALLLESSTPESIREAKGLLERLVQRNAKDERAFATLIQIEMSQGGLDTAGAIVDRALAANPRSPRLLTIGAAVQLARKDLARARSMARQAVGEDPNYVAGYLRLADIAMASDDWESALEAVESAAGIAPDDEAIARKRIGILQRSGRRSEAIRHLKTLVETDTGQADVRLLLLLADLLCQEGDVAGFERSILDASRLNPMAPAVFRVRVRCLGRQKQFDEVVNLIKDRQSQHPSDSESLVLAARVLMTARADRYFTEARSVFVRMLDSDPLSANLGLGELGYQTGDFAAARDAYQNVLKLDPKHEQALNDLAWILAQELEDLDQAIRLADQGVKLYGQNPHLLDTRGVVLWKLGRLDEAVRNLQKSASIAEKLRRWRTQVEALMHLAEVYVDRKELIKARLVLEEANALDAQRAILSDAKRAELDQLIAQTRPAE